MDNGDKLKVIDNNGDTKEYDILYAFYWMKTDRNYIIYTDNSKNEMGKLNIYASIYYPDNKNKIENIKTDEEWKIINKRLNRELGDVYAKH